MNQTAVILIVDDIVSNRETLRELLDTPEYQLVEAADGPTALRLAAENPPDLILLDVMMPGMDGYEVCRRLRADACLAEVPVIMVTALDDSASLIAGLTAGADDFLSKPFNRAALRARVRTITRLNRYRRLLETRAALEAETVEHKKAEESLRLLVAAVEQSNDSIIITDAELTAPGPRILFVNSGFTKMTGYTAAEVLGKTPRILQGPGSDATVLRRLRESLGRGDIFKGETINYRKNGEAFDLDWHISPIRNEKGAITHFAAIQRDITDRKQAERSLRQSEEEYRGLFNSIEEGFCIVEVLFSPSGQPYDYRFLQVNPSFERQSGLSAPTGNTILELVPTMEVQWIERMGKVALTGETARFSKEAKGLERWFEVNAFRLGAASDHKVAILFNDVTERKRAEAEIKTINVQLERRVIERTEQLEESNAKLQIAKSAAEFANVAKSDFLSHMSHELRSPLNAILGFAQLMEVASPTPSQTKRISQILKAGWYLLKLIDEILDLTVIESGKVSLSLEAVLLSELLFECETMFEPQAQKSGIQMSFLGCKERIYVKADRTRLKQILINLISNALKYNSENGTIAVECRSSGPKRIRIQVTDSGAGLSSEQQAQLFQPFNRLGREKSAVSGTGIGLVVSKQLAELMGGSIGIQSAVGVGSVFWCDLAVADAPRLAIRNDGVEAAPERGMEQPAMRRTMLYIEDNPANMTLMEELIELCPGVELLTAVNGALGIEIARATLPVAILMDINLPGMSGIEALKILHKDPITMHIPIVAVSANAMPRDVAIGMKAGFFRYLTKPIHINEFLTMVKAVLEYTEKSEGNASPLSEHYPV